MSRNHIPLRARLTEFLIDYFVIVLYLVTLLFISMLLYGLFLEGAPRVTEMQSQAIATSTSVIPIIIWFSILDWRDGSFGKRKAGLVVAYHTRAFWRAILRNCVKFLPWQLAHIGVISGMYSQWESPLTFMYIYSSLILGGALLAMGLFRSDNRHLGDMVAGTQVIKKSL
jgi:uncharacterized RDD family membrane protein YckC